MNFRTLISIVLFIILCLFANRWFQNNFCCDSTTQEVFEKGMSDVAVLAAGPLVTHWNSADLVTSNKWPIRKSEIMASKGDNRILKITGSYYADEANNTDYESLGLARAENAKILMSDEIAADKIKTSSNLLNGSINDKKTPLELLAFQWGNGEKKESIEKVAESNVSEPKSVEILDGEVLFRFPYKSTEKIDDVGINEYLTQLAEQLKSTNQTVTLVGHTDAKGSKPYNQKLGLERSKAIKAILVGMGVNANRITATSKGETEPIASEDTEAGKQANRRVSLKVN